MLEKFIAWFIAYGLSCILSNILKELGQEQIFFYIYAGVPIILLIFEMRFATKEIDSILKEIGENESGDTVNGKITLILAIGFAFDFIVVLIATWGVTAIFKLNFLVAYQIVTFGKCLCGNQAELQEQ